ncbi:CpaD family pilus assembly protein [Roseibium algae]|uniref:CpaD family pilus assembly protein n=1 Tax=Roseibium algae TaxID=3123038 RepID=A0ABU8TPU5_9HYPH
MSFSANTLFPRTLRIGISLACFGVLAGCQTNTGDSQTSALAANDYRLRHPIVITEQPETLDLPIGYNTRSLNRDLSDSVAAFGSQSLQNGDGAVEILVPAGAGNESAVHAVTPKIRSALKRGGVLGRYITTRSYAVEDASAQAPIRLSYARVMATAGTCGEWPRDIGGGFNVNRDYENFGCASQANLAAMVSNPTDLITPRASTPPDQMRRVVTFEKYRAGDTTASQYKEGVGAEIAE